MIFKTACKKDIPQLTKLRVELKASKMGAPVYEKAGFELEHDVHQPMVLSLEN